MKVILAAWSLGLQAGARGVELPEKKVSGGEREFSYSFVTFKPEVDLHSPLFYVVGTMYYIVCTTYIVCSRGLRRARLLPCEKWVNMGGTREQLAATTMRDFATSGQLVLDWISFKFCFALHLPINIQQMINVAIVSIMAKPYILQKISFQFGSLPLRQNATKYLVL